MMTRSIGKVLRGKATPLQLSLACVLGSLLGFLPGYADGGVFLQAPGLLITLFICLMISSANLPLAAMVAMIAKLVSLAVMPLNFAVGRLLLDGPTQPIFQTAINMPVLALFGLEYYATTGGVVVGAIFGMLAAVVVVSLVRSFRRRMAKLEQGSEAFKKYAAKRWVKILTFVLIGGNKGKRSYAQLAEARMGNPIRSLGVVAALLLVGLAFLVNALARDEIVTATLRRGLEQANGATVDLERAELDLRSGKLVVTGLAIADPKALDTDLFRAAHIEADVSGRDLLRKRFAFDRVVAAEAYTGEKRQIPGRITRRSPAPPREPEPREPGEKRLEDYIEDAKRWKERLEQVKHWIDQVERERDPDVEPVERRETLRERLAREVREKGYARVAASHLVTGAPTVLIRELRLEGVRRPPLAGREEPEILDVLAENVSTHPWLVDETMTVRVRSRSDDFVLDAQLHSLARADRDSDIQIAYRNLPADHISRQLRIRDPRPLQGGTINFTSSGTLSRGGRFHLPLEVSIENTTVAVPKLGSAPVSRLVLPVGVAGRIDDPRIVWDQEAFAEALAEAGANELAAMVRAELEQRLDQARAQLTSRVEETAADLRARTEERAAELIGDRLDGLKDTKKEDLKEEVQEKKDELKEEVQEKKEEAKEKVEERIGEEIRRLLPRRRESGQDGGK